MFKTLTTCVVSLCIASSASAELVNPVVPDWRGDANTTYAQWESFTSADGGPNAPEQGFGYNLFNFGTGAIIASSGNLYGAGGALNIHVYPAGAPLFNLQKAVVNISFAGNPIDTADVRAFVGEAATGEFFTMTGEERSTGFASTWAFEVDLTGAARGFQSLSFFFGSGDLSNCSLDAISIDVLGSAIPATGALVGFGLLGVARRRRR